MTLKTASQTYALNTNHITYGFDIYHGDDDHGAIQFGAASTASATPPLYPARQFCWMKSSQGSSSRDPLYHTHMHQARAAQASHDFLPGAYHFLSPSDSAQSQFLNWITAIKDDLVKGTTLIPMLDVEPLHSVYPSADLAFAVASKMKTETGFWPIIYCSDADYKEHYDEAFPSDMHTLCIARYATSDPVPNPDPLVSLPTTPCAFHQYTGTGRIQGQSSKQNFDLDVYFGSFADLKAKHTIR